MNENADMSSHANCYVHVQGEASGPDDEGVQGVYLVTVDLNGHMPNAPGSLQPTSDVVKALSDIAKAVLDEFHDRVGIEVVDDFTITLYLENGVEIHEAFDTPQTRLVNGATFHGKVDDEWVPPKSPSSPEATPVEDGTCARQPTVNTGPGSLWQQARSAVLTPTGKQKEAYGRFLHTLSAASIIGAVSVAYSHKTVAWDSLVLVAWAVVLLNTGAIMSKGE